MNTYKRHRFPPRYHFLRRVALLSLQPQPPRYRRLTRPARHHSIQRSDSIVEYQVRRQLRQESEKKIQQSSGNASLYLLVRKPGRASPPVLQRSQFSTTCHSGAAREALNMAGLSQCRFIGLSKLEPVFPGQHRPHEALRTGHPVSE
jgi:hypothetical protein